MTAPSERQVPREPQPLTLPERRRRARASAREANDPREIVGVEGGPAHESALAGEDDPFLAEVALPDVAVRLLPLPIDVLYELALSPAVRLAAAGIELTQAQLDEIADACWRAVSRPE